VFLLDVFAWEMKTILVHLFINGYERVFQEEILSMMLTMDDSPYVKKLDDDEDAGRRALNEGVRVIQTGLALFYLRHDHADFATMVIDDMVDDYRNQSADEIIATVTRITNRLANQKPRFWEDTDRGTTNMYFVRETDRIPEFIETFRRRIADRKRSSG
jgi:hypothetical protein